MTIEFVVLRDHPEFLPIVADWYFNEWGGHVAGHTLAAERERVETVEEGSVLPLLLIALDAGEPVAVARLKRHERTEHPEREYWLGGVYVHASCRGRGVAAQLIDALMERAVGLGVRDVHLQTKVDDGGLYRRLGWRPLESIQHEAGFPVRIMCRTLGSNGT